VGCQIGAHAAEIFLNAAKRTIRGPRARDGCGEFS
jgi:hypothetical protein